MKKEVEKIIRETLVISNPQSLYIAVDKIDNILNQQTKEKDGKIKCLSDTLRASEANYVGKNEELKDEIDKKDDEIERLNIIQIALKECIESSCKETQLLKDEIERTKQ